MKRRLFIIMAGAAWLANPAQSQAQRGDKAYRIGLFHVGTDHVPPSLDGLREGLNSRGYDTGTNPASIESTLITGRNIRLDWRNVSDESAARKTAQVFVGDRVNVAIRYVEPILKGRKPSDLPVEDVSEFELAVNLKTARDFGLTLAPSALVRANHVIE